ncbi:suppressor of fused domain protein [Solibacillus sp. A46]|uniref:Suppressor of fused domain protein n=1 Tax=Solibacillus faecavium TaxID=2762221 RepID=A0ABR8XZK5_9BACL|nr:suppressor of fused domain protein [Solibacillus faecavium]MBD8037386.1 suppressor of fused domain protein [Solibacillus faecavium]
MSISNENKIIAKTALHAFGGKPCVSKYWDENNVSNIDMLSTVNRPFDGVSSYSTIGLSDHSIELTVDETPLRIEIVGAIATGYKQYPNILASCAFCIINSKFSVSHGSVFRDIIKMYYPNTEMKHILFVSPFLWEDLNTLEFPNKKVAWLLAVPISENEYLFAQEKGTDTLEELFEQEEIDIFDLERESIL